MSIQVGPGGIRPGLVPVSRKIALVAMLAITSGCISPAFRDSVGQFGTVTKTTVTAQGQQLAAISATEQERIRAQLAANRVDLVLAPSCAETLAPNDTGTADPPAPVCTLARADGTALTDAPRYEHILALGAALSAYADSLIALAADSSQDQKAFAGSLSALATSLGGLDGAIQRVTGGDRAASQPQLNAVATLVAEAGNLYFAYERSRVLKRIIIAGDPTVQRAVDLLTGADAGIDLYNRNALLLHLRATANNARRLAANPGTSATAMRAAQDALFAEVATYNRYAAGVQRFRAIGAAHTQLVRAARANASAADLAAAIQAIIHLAGTAHDTVTTLTPEQGSNNNGN
jgi:hypothetical protein